MEEEHFVGLKRFFEARLEEMRLKNALYGTVPENGARKPLKYEVTETEFKLVNQFSRDVVVSQPRIPRINIQESLDDYDAKLKVISKELLDIKYMFLFEYRSMDMYESNLELQILPREREYDRLLKEKNDLEKKINENEEELVKKVKEVLLSQQARRAELQEEENEIEKRESMRKYVLLQKKLYTLTKDKKNMTELDVSKKKSAPYVHIAADATAVVTKPATQVIGLSASTETSAETSTGNIARKISVSHKNINSNEEEKKGSDNEEQKSSGIVIRKLLNRVRKL
jgi:hypothetical protein